MSEAYDENPSTSVDKSTKDNKSKSVKVKNSLGILRKSRSEDETPESSQPYSITEEELQKRLEASTGSGRKITQMYSCLVVSMGHLSFGTCLGWASPLLAVGRNEPNAKDFSGFYTWMTAMVPLGACVGFGVWTVMGYKNGPRKTLIVQTVIYLLLWISFFWITARGFVQGGRFFMGFCGIAYIVCGQMLMSDTVHITLLKYMRILPQIAILLGVFFVQLSGIFSASGNGALVCIGITISTLIMLIIMPESPVHLYQRGEKQAEDSLRWYIGRKNISESMRRIRKYYEYRRMNVEDKYMLNSSVVKKGVFIIVGIVIFQVGSSYHLFLFYGTMIWSKVPLINEEADVVVLGIVLIFSKLFWSVAHLKIKFSARLALMLSCTIVATAQLVLAAILFFLSFEICVSTHYLRWCCFICCFFLIFGFELGLNHYTGVLVYLYLPFQVYQTAMTIVNSVFWFLIFFIIKVHGFWHTQLPSWLLFFIASIFLFIGALYVYFFVVEVKGRSLIHIQLDLGGNPVGTRASIGMRTGADDI